MIYRFRAECFRDVAELIESLESYTITLQREKEPDVEVELQTSLDMEALRDLMRQIEDSHVMIQTLTLKEQYTGERNYDLG
jgi:hypothetical protein